MKCSRNSERGIALLATMMGVALMTIAVMDFTASATLGYRSAANQANELRADYLARSGVNLGYALLAQDARNDADSNNGEAVDALDEPWARPYSSPVGGGSAYVSIVDEDRKLNINQLVDPQTNQGNPNFLMMVTRLFQLIGVKPDILPAIVDWLDADSVTSQGGAEADYYLRLIPPYEPRNGPMPTIGDLRMVRGVDDRTFMRLSQFLTVYPTAPAGGTSLNQLQPVNINTAPPEVIAALAPDLASNPSELREILTQRLEQPFTQQDLQNLPGFDSPAGGSAGVGGNPPTVQSLFVTNSKVFTIEGRGSYAGARKLVFATVIRNPSNGGQGQVSPLLLVAWHED